MEVQIVLEVTNVSKSFHSGFWHNKKVNAVSDVSFQVEGGEIFGLIGGSGCGKTTTSRMIMGFVKPDLGRILFDGRELTALTRKEWLGMRKSIQMVFQNPQMTFNPRFTIYNCCAEPIRIFHLAENRDEERAMVYEMLDSVGVSRDQVNKYPHEISGGQAQRISIIRSLFLNPKLLICDEPTSMLDVSVQAQIIELLRTKQCEKKTSILYISHDLDTIRAICSRVAVMNDGCIVETGTVEKVFGAPEHPYTRALISSAI